ncbi:claudin-7 [Phasianus colchicus]|uniref:claudin-7 n=1 Tax=Phasianus colchicus TaxID=9054 RepID=UPI00129E9D49|nr:claudin-7 [Phasianus colchicus]
MASGGLELLGLALALGGWGAVVAATALWQWQTSTYAGDNIVTAVSTYQGLWGSCVSTSTGQLQCKAYDSLLALPGELGRVWGGPVFGLISHDFRSIFGVPFWGPFLDSFPVISAHFWAHFPRFQVHFRGALLGPILGSFPAISAHFGLISRPFPGLCALIACSWFAHRVITDFYSPTIPTNLKYELGPALFVGWGGAALLLLGGAALLCSCRTGTGTGTARYPRVKAAPRKTGSGSATDYV